MTSGGDGICDPSEEIRNKISIAFKGKKQSPENIQKRINGIKNSEKAKLAWKSESRKIKIHNTKIKNGTYALSEETKKNISLCQIGRKHSEQTKQKMSISHYKHITTEETRQNISDALKSSEKAKSMWNSPERNRKLSEKLTGRKRPQEEIDKIKANTFFKNNKGPKEILYNKYGEIEGEIRWQIRLQKCRETRKNKNINFKENI